MARLTGIVLGALACAIAVTALAEIVKVTSPEIQVFDGEKWAPRKLQGKRFMVYDAKGGLYYIQLSAKQGTYAWVRAQDVQVDWGKSKVRTATVASVANVNTLKLTDGSLVQFRRVLVPMDETELKRQTEAWLKKALEGKEVTLEFETTDKNARGYPEAYVYVNGMFLNRTLVEYGLATVPLSNSKGCYDTVLSHYAKQASEKGRGIWKEERPEDESDQELASDAGEAEVAQPRKLTRADRQQWALRLQIGVRVLKEDLTYLDPEGSGTCEGPTGPEVDDDIVTGGPRPKDYDGIVPAG